MDIPGGCKQTKQITGEARPVNKTRWVVSQPDAGRIHCPGFFQFNPIPSIHFGAISAIEKNAIDWLKKLVIYIYMYVYIYTYIPVIPHYTGQKHPHEKRLLSPWFHGPSGSSRLFAFAGLQIS